MSEFSESFHLRSNDQADGIELVRRSKMAGYVFEPRDGWVTVLFPPDSIPGSGAREDRIIAANRLLLVQYFYADEHGCGADLFEADARVGRVEVSFESAKSSFDREAFVSRGLLTEEAAAKVDAWVHGSRDRGNLVLAGSLRLPRHEWCSFDYEEGHQNPGSRVEVDKHGNFVANEEDPDESLSTEAPADARPGAAFVRLRAALESLVNDGRLELTPGGELDALVEAILTKLRDRRGGDPTRAIVACIEGHDVVAELYADDDEVRAALSRSA